MALGAGMVVGPSRTLVGPCRSLVGSSCPIVIQGSQTSQWRRFHSATSDRPRSLRHHFRAAGRPRPPALQSSRSLALSASRGFQPKLAPSEVTSVLRSNEYTCSDLPPGPVKFFDTNSLQSNDPIEDSYASALTVGGGYLFGIFDGHGGAACGQVFTNQTKFCVNMLSSRWLLRGCCTTLQLAC